MLCQAGLTGLGGRHLGSYWAHLIAAPPPRQFDFEAPVHLHRGGPLPAGTGGEFIPVEGTAPGSPGALTPQRPGQTGFAPLSRTLNSVSFPLSLLSFLYCCLPAPAAAVTRMRVTRISGSSGGSEKNRQPPARWLWGEIFKEDGVRVRREAKGLCVFPSVTSDLRKAVRRLEGAGERAKGTFPRPKVKKC